MAAVGRVLRPLRATRFCSFSTIQAQSKPNDAIKDNDDVSKSFAKPPLIGIQPWNKLLEPINQSTFITKSIVQPGLPTHFSKTAVEETDENSVLGERFKEIVEQSLLFCYEPSPKLKYKHRRIFNSKLREEMKKLVRKDKISLDLMMNALLLAYMSENESGLTHRNSVLAYHPQLRACFERGEQQLSISGQLGHLLLCSEPLLPFASSDKITASEGVDISWSNIISPFFHLHDDPLLKHLNRDGIHNTSSFKHPHTIFVPIKSGKKVNFKSNDLVSQGVLYCFGRALNSALSDHGNKFGAERIDPVSVQYVACNDNKLTFVCFQLNTLDLLSDNGVKNFVWIEPEVPIYSSCTEVISGPTRQQRRKYLPHEKASGQVHDFNPDALSLFMNLLNAPLKIDR